ncbi:hypothetical protein RFI_23003 [Reticulomyxa filosa]|uniref:Uncharacterized protein n=1 Tax=Reticulomyxa filosa TaxID=46433 RepID=X6MKL6_RETFI|nr:hypothetical protein RFI_23003 [Reticulomyxa filosa]|eukprot:ETO14364.1 hypothetical protein RFI_23003 [Reticulomyxa filosa]
MSIFVCTAVIEEIFYYQSRATFTCSCGNTLDNNEKVDYAFFERKVLAATQNIDFAFMIELIFENTKCFLGLKGTTQITSKKRKREGYDEHLEVQHLTKRLKTTVSKMTMMSEMMTLSLSFSLQMLQTPQRIVLSIDEISQGSKKLLIFYESKSWKWRTCNITFQVTFKSVKDAAQVIKACIGEEKNLCLMVIYLLYCWYSRTTTIFSFHVTFFFIYFNCYWKCTLNINNCRFKKTMNKSRNCNAILKNMCSHWTNRHAQSCSLPKSTSASANEKNSYENMQQLCDAMKKLYEKDQWLNYPVEQTNKNSKFIFM